MYQRGLPPRIHLSARRPLPWRTYNCAQELGHHVFGHVSSIDELREDAKAQPWDDPKEFLADTFAGFALMSSARVAPLLCDAGRRKRRRQRRYSLSPAGSVGYATLLRFSARAASKVSDCSRSLSGSANLQAPAR
ncbi:ImmA/IrrE family metallo-endopeptidase [Bradyrhizobium sp. USDA 4510]